MKQQDYFIVVLAHSLHGRLRRVHIPQQLVYSIFFLALLGWFSVAGFVASYARMAWKVANYNSLRAGRAARPLPEPAERGHRDRYPDGQPATVRQGSFRGVRNQAEAGRPRGYFRRRPAGSDFLRTVQEYDYLRSVTALRRNYGRRLQAHAAEPVAHRRAVAEPIRRRGWTRSRAKARCIPAWISKRPRARRCARRRMAWCTRGTLRRLRAAGDCSTTATASRPTTRTFRAST